MNPPRATDTGWPEDSEHIDVEQLESLLVQGPPDEEPKSPRQEPTIEPTGTVDVRDMGLAPLRHQSVPAIDPAAYHGPVGDYVRVLAPTTESDPVAVLVQCLAWVGCGIGRTAHLRHGSVVNYPAVWPLLVGPTSTGRKGNSEADSLSALSALSAQARRRSGLSSGEGLIEAFLAQGDDEPPNPRLLILESEWEAVLARVRRENNTLSAVLRDAWDHRPLSTMNAGGGSRNVDDYTLVVCGHITANALREGMLGKDLSNGFLNRFLLTQVHRPQLVPWPESATPQIKAAAQHIVDLTESVHSAAVGPVVLTSESRAAYAAWYCAREQDNQQPAERVAQASARAVPNLLRLSMIYALLDGSQVVEAVHLAAARAVVDHSQRSAEALLAPGNAGPDARILDALQGRPMTRGELRDLFSRHLSKDSLSAAIESLLDEGLIEAEQRDTGGRPATVYRCAAARKARKARKGSSDA